MLVEGLDPDGTDAVADGERCELVATSLFNRTAPLDPVPLRRHRAPHATSRARADARTRACGRIGRKSDEIVVDGKPGAADRRVGRGRVRRRVRDGPVPGDPHRTAGRPPAAARRLRARVRGQRLARSSDDVRGAVLAASGVEPDVELVPERGAAASSVRRTRSRGWPSDDATMTDEAAVGVGAYETAPGATSWEISARGDPTRHRRSATRALEALGVRGGDRVLCCSMLSEAGQFWPFIVRHDAGGRAALVRRRDRRRSGARRDVPAAHALRRRARRHRRDPRRPRRARPSVRRRLRRVDIVGAAPERLRAPRGRGARAASLRRCAARRSRSGRGPGSSGVASTPTSGSSTSTRRRSRPRHQSSTARAPSSCARRPRRTAPRPTAASFPTFRGRQL